MSRILQNFTYSLDSKGAVDFKWFYPKKTCGHEFCCFHITVQQISSNLKSNASRSLENETLGNSITYNMRDYRKRLNLLPSTLYNISIETMMMSNETEKLKKSFQLQTLASVGLDGKLRILTQKTDPLIQLRMPKILNDTLDSVTYIILIKPDICEQNIELPKILLEHISKDKMERIWQVVEGPVCITSLSQLD